MIEISSDCRPSDQASNADDDGREDDHSLSRLSNDLSHVSIVTVGKDDKDVPIIKTSAPKIKNENKTMFQVENEQNMSFLSDSRNQNATGKPDKDHSDYNHRQQQSISPKPPPSSGQQFLISSRQSVVVSEQQFNERPEKESNHHRRSRPSSYIEMTQQQESSRELSRESSGREIGRESSSKAGSRHSKADKLQQINDKLNESHLNSPKQKRTASSSSATKCTKTDQASSLELAQRNVKREPSNAGSLSSVESNQQSITRNSKIIEKGMAMVQLRKNKVGDKVSKLIGGKFFFLSKKKVFFASRRVMLYVLCVFRRFSSICASLRSILTV